MNYEVDIYDRRLPPQFRQRLQALLPESIERPDDPNWTFAFDKIVFPEGSWAYVIYRESNPYHAIEYTDVLRWENGKWVLQNHLQVAEGLLETVLYDFNWSRYRQTHLEGNALPATEPSSER